jgi:hypothetical protein
MAGRNQNTFIKRQKEIKRVRKAKEKMARRHGKTLDDGHSLERPLLERPAAPEEKSAPDTEPELAG